MKFKLFHGLTTYYNFSSCKMGNKRSIESMAVSKPLGSSWYPQQNIGYCIILKNIQSGEEAELQTVALQGPLLDEFQRYQYRHSQDQNLIRVLSATANRNKYLCTGQDTVDVVTERIPYLLANVQNLPLADGLFTLHEALIGFMAVHQFEGYVNVTDEMIGFTTDGRVKVWLNPSFGSNHALKEAPDVVDPEEAAERMILDVLRVVQQHIVGQNLPEKLSNIYESEQPTNFIQAVNILREFCLQGRVQMATKVTMPGGVRGSVFHSNTKIVETTTETTYLNKPPQPKVEVTKAYHQEDVSRPNEMLVVNNFGMAELVESKPVMMQPMAMRPVTALELTAQFRSSSPATQPIGFAPPKHHPLVKTHSTKQLQKSPSVGRIEPVALVKSPSVGRIEVSTAMPRSPSGFLQFNGDLERRKSSSKDSKQRVIIRSTSGKEIPQPPKPYIISPKPMEMGLPPKPPINKINQFKLPIKQDDLRRVAAPEQRLVRRSSEHDARNKSIPKPLQPNSQTTQFSNGKPSDQTQQKRIPSTPPTKQQKSVSQMGIQKKNQNGVYHFGQRLLHRNSEQQIVRPPPEGLGNKGEKFQHPSNVRTDIKLERVVQSPGKQNGQIIQNPQPTVQRNQNDPSFKNIQNAQNQQNPKNYQSLQKIKISENAQYQRQPPQQTQQQPQQQQTQVQPQPQKQSQMQEPEQPQSRKQLPEPQIQLIQQPQKQHFASRPTSETPKATPVSEPTVIEARPGSKPESVQIPRLDKLASLQPMAAYVGPAPGPLQILSVPIIQIVQYMPQKGVQMPDPQDNLFQPKIQSQLTKLVDSSAQCDVQRVERRSEQFQRDSDRDVGIYYAVEPNLGSKDTLNFQQPSIPFDCEIQFESGQEIRDMLSGKDVRNQLEEEYLIKMPEAKQQIITAPSDPPTPPEPEPQYHPYPLAEPQTVPRVRFADAPYQPPAKKPKHKNSLMEAGMRIIYGEQEDLMEQDEPQEQDEKSPRLEELFEKRQPAAPPKPKLELYRITDDQPRQTEHDQDPKSGRFGNQGNQVDFLQTVTSKYESETRDYRQNREETKPTRQYTSKYEQLIRKYGGSRTNNDNIGYTSGAVSVPYTPSPTIPISGSDYDLNYYGSSNNLHRGSWRDTSITAERPIIVFDKDSYSRNNPYTTELTTDYNVDYYKNKYSGGSEATLFKESEVGYPTPRSYGCCQDKYRASSSSSSYKPQFHPSSYQALNQNSISSNSYLRKRQDENPIVVFTEKYGGRGSSQDKPQRSSSKMLSYEDLRAKLNTDEGELLKGYGGADRYGKYNSTSAYGSHCPNTAKSYHNNYR